jgi:hypothetical protein
MSFVTFTACALRSEDLSSDPSSFRLTSRTRVAEKGLNPMEVVWNFYGIGMESVWCIRPTSPEQRASNTQATRWCGVPDLPISCGLKRQDCRTLQHQRALRCVRTREASWTESVLTLLVWHVDPSIYHSSSILFIWTRQVLHGRKDALKRTCADVPPPEKQRQGGGSAVAPPW